MTSPIDHHRQTRALLWDADIIDRQRKLANQLISLCTNRVTLEDAPFVSLDAVDEHADEILSVISKNGPCLEILYSGAVTSFGALGERYGKNTVKSKGRIGPCSSSFCVQPAIHAKGWIPRTGSVEKEEKGTKECTALTRPSCFEREKSKRNKIRKKKFN
jgi:hypothetical protein